MGAQGKEQSRFQRDCRGTKGDISNIFWLNNPMKIAKGEREREREIERGRNGKDGGRRGNCGRDSISKSDKGGKGERRMTTIMGRTGVGTTC